MGIQRLLTGPDTWCMSTLAGHFDAELPYPAKLTRLVNVLSAVSAEERLEAALGPELARFLVTALCAGGQGRVGSSSP